MNILAIVEKDSDGLYSVYSEQEINGHGFGGYGESVEEAKADFMQSIEEVKAMAGVEITDLQVTFKFENEGVYAGCNEMRLYLS